MNKYIPNFVTVLCDSPICGAGQRVRQKIHKESVLDVRTCGILNSPCNIDKTNRILFAGTAAEGKPCNSPFSSLIAITMHLNVSKVNCFG
jgi:hypothetical protein